MPAEIIDGRKIAEEIREELKDRIAKLKEWKITPGLAVVLVGEDPASLSYIRMIERGSEACGIHTEVIKLSSGIKQEELEAKIEELNQDEKVHGIIIQLPLPKHLSALSVESKVSPDKDVDGTNPVNTGKLLLGEETFFPSTPSGVQQLLIRSGHAPDGKGVVIFGRSNIVGKPLAAILMQKKVGANATVVICHTGTQKPAVVTKRADILIVAVGRAKFITADMVKEGAVVVDVGVNPMEDPETGKTKIVGDVDFESVKEKAAAITPVPGGTGPVTSVMLMENTVKAAELAEGISKVSAKILDGRKLSAEIREELKGRVSKLKQKGITPGLAGILVGEDPGSVTYVRLKGKACDEVGVMEKIVRLPENITEEELLENIESLNQDPEIHGVFIQLPLPKHLSEQKALAQVLPEKDVDGFHPLNVGKAWMGQPTFFPAVVLAIQEILIRYKHDLKHKNVVIVNVDNMVGKPLASLLVQDEEGAGANTVLCRPTTPDLASCTRRADTLIVSVDKPNFITADMVKGGVWVIDFGSNWIEDPVTGKKKTVGDVDFEGVKEKAGAITPVPGGVGPMLVTMLLSNAITAAERRAGG